MTQIDLSSPLKALLLSSCIVYQSVVYLHRNSLSVPVCHSFSPSLLVSCITVTYNYSADLLPVSITSALQRNCRSVEESIVGVPGGFLDNELAQ